MKKYRVTNCPCLSLIDGEWCDYSMEPCAETDCVIRQVIDKLKEPLNTCESCPADEYGEHICFDCENVVAKRQSKDILEMFLIEEVKDER